MKKYGNRITLLDATYKTTKYSIPLFFVAVKTNVKYMVVGSFAIQEETTEVYGCWVICYSRRNNRSHYRGYGHVKIME